MNLKRLHFFVCITMLLLTASQVLAQNKRASGTVTDAKTGLPLQGVSISVKGTTLGTQTDANGTFSLELPSGATQVEISYVGYTTQTISARSQVNIALQPETGLLNDVVVIGYGTTKKKDLTGSVATVSSKDFNVGALSTPDQLIQGKVPGVVITNTSGQPGMSGTIRIRGGSSLSATNDPLIVIDGIPLSTDGIAGTASPLSTINPNDIETFTVLKDASATAIYGNRASNGVIIITTKKGKSGPVRISFNSVNSLANIAKKVSVLSAGQLRTLVQQKGDSAANSWMGNANTDWQDLIYRTALISDNNLSISGGIKKLPYRVTISYLDQNGTLKTDYLRRTSAALNLNPTLFNNSLKIDVNLKGSVSDYRFGNQSAIGDAIRMNPTLPVRDTGFAKYGGYWEWQNNGVLNSLAPRNPVSELYAQNNTSTVKRSIGNIQLDYRFPFLKELRANLNAGYDISRTNGNSIVNPNSAMGYNNGGSTSPYTQYNRNELFDFYFNYAKELSSLKSRIDVTAGYEYQDFYSAQPGTTTSSILGTSPATGLAVPSTTSLPDSSEHTLVSYYGRLIYTMADKYLLTATIRRDGTSRFAPNNRWGNFPSIALAWRINKEDFLKDVKAISDLKLRIGYGLTGQENIGPKYAYAYLASYTTSTTTARYPFGSTYYTTYRGTSYDTKIQWENTKTYNVGLDYGFLGNRITGSIDLYTRKTDNLLANVPVPLGANLSNFVYTNIGKMSNKGIEFNISAIPVQQKDLQWNVAFNIAYNNYKISSLGPAGNSFTVGGITGGTGTTTQIQAVGYTRNVFYLYKQVYDANGNPIEGVYANVNGDPNNLNYFGKSPDPKVTLGFNTSLNYKKWVFGFSMHGSIGNYVYNNVASNNGFLNNIIVKSNNYVANASTSYLKTGFVSTQPLSDYYLENASFLRMDNMMLGYNFGKVFNDRGNLRLSAIVQNPFVITKYTGLDPEVSSGIDGNIYPKSRVYSLGINLDF